MAFDARKIAEKFKRVTSTRSQDYQDGVANPSKSWEKATLAGEENYKIGVTKAAAAGSHAKGVKKAGDAKWKENTIAKGGARWAEGIAYAEDAYAAAIAPVLQVIDSVDLPPRYPRGDIRNMQRAAKMAEALHKAKAEGRL